MCIPLSPFPMPLRMLSCDDSAFAPLWLPWLYMALVCWAGVAGPGQDDFWPFVSFVRLRLPWLFCMLGWGTSALSPFLILCLLFPSLFCMLSWDDFALSPLAKKYDAKDSPAKRNIKLLLLFGAVLVKYINIAALFLKIVENENDSRIQEFGCICALAVVWASCQQQVARYTKIVGAWGRQVVCYFCM